MLVRLLSLIAAVVLACASTQTQGSGSLPHSEAAHRHFAASITNPRGLQTEIDFMVYDEASEELPLAIRAPEGMTITFDRDAYGKPKSITRSGTSPAVSATRRYVYDANQRLCKVIEPERGAETHFADGALQSITRGSGAEEIGSIRAVWHPLPIGIGHRRWPLRPHVGAFRCARQPDQASERRPHGRQG